MPSKTQKGRGLCFSKAQPTAEEIRAKFGKYISPANQEQFNKDVDELMAQVADKIALEEKYNMPTPPETIQPLSTVGGVKRGRKARAK